MRRALIFTCMAFVFLFVQMGAPAQQPEAASSSPAQVSVASVPRLIQFNGVVRDRNGEPLGGAAARLTFSVYEESQGGAALWTESQVIQLDDQGRYTALLGATASAGVPVELFSAGKARWLGVQVETRDEDPRVLMVSVPYALKAEDAEKLGGKRASDFVLAEQLDEKVRTAVAVLMPADAATAPTGKALAATPAAAPAPKPQPATNFADSNATQVVSVQQNDGGDALAATTASTTAGKAGVRGLASAPSGATVGVSGQVNSPAGTAGLFLNTSTSQTAKILSGRAGAAGTEKFSVDGSGNVTATAFIGNGSGLTGIPSSAGGTVTTVATGAGLTGGPITTAGILSLDTGFMTTNYAAKTHTHVVGDVTGAATLANNFFLGDQNVTGNLSLTGAISSNGLRVETASGEPNVIGGYSGNTVTSGKKGATISGGGASWAANQVTIEFGTVGGGYGNKAGDNDGTTVSATVNGGERNTASGSYSFVGGGKDNVASAHAAVVVGGAQNIASAWNAIVGAGTDNTASGWHSVVPGGRWNVAQGSYSLAGGYHARALHDGTFVWGDSTDAPVESNGPNQFVVRAGGGAFFSDNLTAGHFFGDGSNLTGINVATATDADTVDGAHADFFASQTALSAEAVTRTDADLTLDGAKVSKAGDTMTGPLAVPTLTGGIAVFSTDSPGGAGVSGTGQDIGVYGKSLATSGYHQGVYGENSSTEGAGVWGQNGIPGGTALVAVSTATEGYGRGLAAITNSPNGTAGVFANTVGGPILEGYAGVGENRFSLDGAGNFWTFGTIHAQKGFIGDGSNLTGISAENATNAVHATNADYATTAGSATTAQTAETSNTAGMASFATSAGSADTAGNAMNLGNVPAGSYARVDTGNNFTGGQAIYGNTTDQALKVDQNGSGGGLIVQVTDSNGSTGIVGINYASPGGAGISGEARAASGQTTGIQGAAWSPDGRGVMGRALSTSGQTFGVRAENHSVEGWAIAGDELAETGGTIGVQGTVHSPAGTAGVFMNTAQGKILSGMNTAEGNEVFRVDGSGNVWAAGTFTGDGSGLTGILTQGSLDAEAATRQSADSTLGANLGAESAARAAADATLQSNLNSEVAARANSDTALQSAIDLRAGLGSNSFAGDQSVTGNVSASGDLVAGGSITAATATIGEPMEPGMAVNVKTSMSGIRVRSEGGSTAIKAEATADSSFAVRAIATGSNSTGVAAVGQASGLVAQASSSGGTAGLFYGIGGANILKGQALVDNYLIDMLRVDAAGNLWANGTITSTVGFAGNGSGLTDVTAGTANNLNCLGCVAESELGFDTATQSELNSEATARAALQGNLDAEAAARQAADGSVQASVTAESSARASSDSMLQSNLSAEAAARQSADNSRAQLGASNLYQSSPLGTAIPQTLGPVAEATSDTGYSSNPLDLAASTFSSGYGRYYNPTFRWQAEPVGNNTPDISAKLSLHYGIQLFGYEGPPLVPTGLWINPDGTLNFAPAQSFPGTGDISSVNVGTGLTGGGTSGDLMLVLDTIFTDGRYSLLGHTHSVGQVSGAATTSGNNFVGTQNVNGTVAVTGNITASGSVTSASASIVGSTSEQLLNVSQLSGGDAIRATAAWGAGLRATSSDPNGGGVGVVAVGTGTGAQATGAYVGLEAQATSTNPPGVGVRGTGSTGVQGISPDYAGVEGRSSNMGVLGVSTGSGSGVVAQGGAYGVFASGNTGVFVYGSAAGVEARADSVGVKGISNNSGASGVWGLGLGDGSLGVLGEAGGNNGIGVKGSTSQTDVWGDGYYIGVKGTSIYAPGVTGILAEQSTGAGVHGSTNAPGGAGVLAETSGGGWAGIFRNSTGDYALRMLGGYLLEGRQGAQLNFLVDYNGNVYAPGYRDMQGHSVIGGPATDLACTTCVSTGELDFDPATQAEMEGEAGAREAGDAALALDKVSKSGDTMTGPLTLPANGLVAGNDQLVLLAGNVGIGTTSPSAKLEVAGKIKSQNARAWAFASNTISNSSTSWTDMPNMTVNVSTGNAPVLIQVNIGATWHDTNDSYGYFRLLIDGEVKATNSVKYMSLGWLSVPMIHMENLAADTHTIQIQWRTDKGTLRASEESSTRSLIAIEF